MPFAPKTEARWLALGVAGAMLLAVLPALFASWLAPAGWQPIGTTVLNLTDAPVYYSYIDQGRTGGWWMTDRFTTEPIGQTLWQPLWWALGRVANFASLSTPMIYLLARIAAAGGLAVVIWWAAGWLFNSARERRWAVGLALFSGGVGGAAWLIAGTFGANIGVTPDMWVAEIFPALSMMHSPHFALVTAGLIGAYVGLERLAKTWRWRYLLTAMTGTVIVASLHPFHLVTIAIVVGARLASRAWYQESTRTYFFGAVGIGLVAALPGLASIWPHLTSPWLQLRAEQNIALTWPAWQTIVVLGIFSVAVVRFRDWPRADARIRLLLIWAAVAVIVVFLPFSFQRRLSQALAVPWIFLSVPILLQWLDRSRLRRWSAAALATVAGLGTLVALAIIWRGFVFDRGLSDPQLYISPDEQAVYAGLESLPGAPEAVLGDPTTGLRVAGLGRQKAVVGHEVETINFSEKRDAVEKFFRWPDPEYQRAVIDRYGVCWVVVGPRERGLGAGFNPGALSADPAIQTKTVLAYRTCP